MKIVHHTLYTWGTFRTRKRQTLRTENASMRRKSPREYCKSLSTQQESRWDGFCLFQFIWSEPQKKLSALDSSRNFWRVMDITEHWFLCLQLHSMLFNRIRSPVLRNEISQFRVDIWFNKIACIPNHAQINHSTIWLQLRNPIKKLLL